MARYRSHLPQLSGKPFLTDGGIETTLIFHEGLSLPYFAAFDLLRDPTGYAALQRYFHPYVVLAQRYAVGCILESATWRASADWGTKLGYSTSALVEANRQAMALLHGIRDTYDAASIPLVLSGCIGPRGDGYNPAAFMTAAEAADYHGLQAATLREADADVLTAITMTYAEEAMGITRAAQAVGIPVVISFTVETDGHLPSGQPLSEAIRQVDAATAQGPVYYMLNCAHPSHFADVLVADTPWTARIRGLRANASTKSHAELDEATELDCGDPAALAQHYRRLRHTLRHLNVLGGCCGTDHRHIEAICRSWLSAD